LFDDNQSENSSANSDDENNKTPGDPKDNSTNISNNILGGYAANLGLSQFGIDHDFK